MNNTSSKGPALLINLKEVIWDLLQQWKAVLIAALIMMLLLTGLKHFKDTRAYDASKAAQETAEQVDISAEERIENILAALPDDERMTVEYMSKQEDWMIAEKEYISNSILMNTNPASQRTLTLDYLITAADGSDSNMFSLLNGYSGFSSNEEFVQSVGDAIAPDADRKYIAELIRVGNGSNYIVNEGKSLVTNSDDDSAVISYYIVLPEETDAEEVEKAATNALKEYSSRLSSKIGKHSIELLNSSESYQYNADLINNRNNIIYGVYNMTNNTKNMKNSLSDAQKAAVESISAIKKEVANVDGVADAAESAAPEPQKPGFSKKYALMGFVLGAFAYAFAYLILFIMRGCVNSASDAEYYTQNRLLGEVYGDRKPTGLAKLLHSSLVDNIRYRGKTDAAAQVSKAVDAVDAACEHAQTKKLTLFDMTGGAGAQTGDIINGIRGKGIDVNIVDAANGVEDKNLLDVEDSVLLIGPETKIPLLSGLMSLCADYDVRSLGSIYTA